MNCRISYACNPIEKGKKMDNIYKRKDDHIKICLEEYEKKNRIESPVFDSVELTHRAFPEINRDDVDPSIELLNKKLSFPLIIGSMTGGTPGGKKINRRLAEAAEKTRIGMCLGSQRIMIEQPETVETFCVREMAPDILLISNIGAVQLNKGLTAKECNTIVSKVGADALVFHLNPAHEALQEGGDTCFKGIINSLKRIVPCINVPCGIKETGCGFSLADVKLAKSLPIQFIESAGKGGTSWPWIEEKRAENKKAGKPEGIFKDWGISSIQSLLHCVKYLKKIPVIASGGIRTGLDILKAVALGARSAAIALPFLHHANQSVELLCREIEVIKETFVTGMFLIGVKGVEELRLKGRSKGLIRFCY